MQLRDLMVVLDGSTRRAAILDVAVSLARRHDARLIGFCPLDLLYPGNLAFALSGYPEMIALQDAADQLRAQAEEKARGVEADFRERLRRDGLRGDWEIAGGAAGEAVARRARASDLLLLGQNDPAHPLPMAVRHLPEEALMNCGRPLLIVPFAGEFATIGSNVLIGWSGTREAARAVHDALLLIEPAATVTVLTVEHARRASETREIPGAEIAGHLARHGLKVSAARTVTDSGISDGDALLAYASDNGADLLVVGGYGHSRAREMVLGGVSRELLDHMTLPVVMSH
jgi:nucleotide-binding universal stress UspA family protein